MALLLHCLPWRSLPAPGSSCSSGGGGHSQCLGVRAPCALSPRGSRSAALVAQQNPGWIVPGDLEEFPLWSWCCVLALLFSAALILLILPPLFPPHHHHLKSLISSSSWARQLLRSCEAFSAEAVPVLKTVASLRGCGLVWEHFWCLAPYRTSTSRGLVSQMAEPPGGELGRVGAQRRQLARL